MNTDKFTYHDGDKLLIRYADNRAPSLPGKYTLFDGDDVGQHVELVRNDEDDEPPFHVFDEDGILCPWDIDDLGSARWHFVEGWV